MLSTSPFLGTYDNILFNIDLEIVSATGINAGEYFGFGAGRHGKFSSSDAYTSIIINGQPMDLTRPIFDTLEPEWNEKFYFQNVPRDSKFSLIVMDTDLYNDDKLGVAQFPVRHVMNDIDVAYDLPLTLKDRKAGVLSIKVTCHHVNTDENALIEEVGPVRYSMHTSFSKDLLRAFSSRNAKLYSFAYTVRLHNIPRFLPSNIEWTKSYKKAQHVFSSKHPESPVFRRAVKTQHAMTYEHNRKSSKFGALSSPLDFFNLINDGKRDNKPVLFTYVITSKGWYFSETGATFLKDIMSKHMLHSNAAYYVKYAGEFHVQKTSNNTLKLVLDNNSGTYTPPKFLLPELKALIENNFDSIDCEVVDLNDRMLMKAREKILAAWN
ncbi:hypothetical protein CCR75_008465 [Bremia lactucae]|uniref:C2 domain-containing protein n=1 Tax=Bremia lactucae TaxID=4779 RepID=A0A976FGJ7_BRELC|nr:hypothetical protein CCR75_008465 [Bremia lactucae]